ncbi:MAG: GIY-YIG nuclease family protein [Chloroflexi bacterium]|nr:GIY-YIG nuclease family protein [Chloroflexota bacterium]
MRIDQLPCESGSYVLILEIKRSQVLTIGRLGQVPLPVGVYAYAGSAFGSGGLRSRLGRHLRGDGTLHWHIDYLRAKAHVLSCFYTVSDTRLECAWSQALAALPGATIPVPGFGASDCRSGCAAHLISLPLRANVRRVLAAVAQSTVVPLQLR